MPIRPASHAKDVEKKSHLFNRVGFSVSFLRTFSNSIIVALFFAVVFGVFLNISNVCFADVVILKNGGSLEGEVTKRPNGDLEVNSGGMSMVVSRDEIEKIIKDTPEEKARQTAKNLLAESKYEEAVAALEALPNLSDAGKKYAAEICLKKAELLAVAGKQESERWLAKARAFDPSMPKVVKGQNPFFNGAFEKELKAARKQYLLGDFRVAAKSFAELEKRYPQAKATFARVQACAEGSIAEEYFWSNNFAETYRWGIAALKHDSTLPEDFVWYVIFTAIRHSQEKTKPSEARDILRAAEPFSRNDRRFMLVLGDTEMKNRDFSAGAKAYAKALGQSPPADVTQQKAMALRDKLDALVPEKSFRFNTFDFVVEDVNKDEKGDWQKIETPHYIIYHRNREIGEDYAAVVEEHLAATIKVLTGGDKLEIPKKIDLYIYPTRAEYNKVYGKESDNSGFHRVTYDEKGLASAEIHAFQGGKQIFDNMLPHEIAHSVFRFLLGGDNDELKVIHEGVATSFETEKPKRAKWMEFEKYYTSGKLYSWKKMAEYNDYPEEYPLCIFYVQSLALVDFLKAKKDLPTLAKFSRQIKKSGFEKALQEVYGFKDFDEFQRGLDVHLKKIAAAKGMPLFAPPQNKK